MVNRRRSVRRAMDSITRRKCLRACGVALALPFLEGLAPAAVGGPRPTRRMVAINLGLGVLTPNFVPSGAGRDYELTKYLETLKGVRREFTVISGTSHPNVD